MRKLTLLLAAASLAAGADFKAGLGAVRITPQAPVRMSGYAGRSAPSTGVEHDLWAKALAIEDKAGRFLVVTLDLVTIPGNFAADLAARIASRHRVARERLLLNCSHTHAGPVLGSNAYALPEVEASAVPPVEHYTEWVKKRILEAADAAFADLAPARLELTYDRAGFAANRRERTASGYRIGHNPQGPVDHGVPAIAIRTPQGRLRGVLFGYSCHATTLGAKNLIIGGDYPGFAQIEIEKRHPGAKALFLQLCGADQNPNPRGTMEDARRHGGELADAVDRALAARPRRLRPPLKAALVVAQLPFPDYGRERFEARLKDSNQYRARHARKMLELLDAGRPIRSIPYPVQAVRFGRDAALVALGGEVVIDYALRAQKEFPRERLIVAGYSNDVMCYIPSLRVLKEGGYEADDSLVYDGMPGPFAENVEETVFAAIRAVLRSTAR